MQAIESVENVSEEGEGGGSNSRTSSSSNGKSLNCIEYMLNVCIVSSLGLMEQTIHCQLIGLDGLTDRRVLTAPS